MTSSAVASRFCGTATPKRFRGLEIDLEHEFCRQLHRQVVGVFAPFKMRRIDIRNDDKAATGRFVEPIRGLRRPQKVPLTSAIHRTCCLQVASAYDVSQKLDDPAVLVGFASPCVSRAASRLRFLSSSCAWSRFVPR